MKKYVVLLLLVVVFGVSFGNVDAFASDTIDVNGVNAKVGNEIEVVVNINKYDKLLSGYVGKVIYDKSVLEVKEVYDVNKDITYNQNDESIKFARAEATEGITISKKESLLKIKFKVISAQNKNVSIECVAEDIYSLNKEEQQDVKTEDSNKLLSIEVKNKVENSGNSFIPNTGDASYIVIAVIGVAVTSLSFVIYKRKKIRAY